MIGISVSDIIKLLDQIPVWKHLAALPKRLEALDARVAELEAAGRKPPATSAINPAKACPMCGTEMKVISETGHPTFHFAGVKVHGMECPECHEMVSRDFHPGQGYT